MSSFDAAPLPRLGQVFFDVRGSSRSMRVSWYGDTGVAVFSIWQGGRCTGTFRLPVDDLARMVDTLRGGPDGDPGGQPHPAPGTADPGYPEPGYPEPAYPEPGYPDSGYPEAGYPDSGYPEPAGAYAPGPPPPGLSAAGQPGQPAPDRAGPDRSGAGRAGPERPGSERPGPDRRPERRSSGGHAVQVDPADPLGLGLTDDPAAGYRDSGYRDTGYPEMSDPYGPYGPGDSDPYGPADGGPTDPGRSGSQPYGREYPRGGRAEPGYPADPAYGPPDAGYRDDREPEYPDGSHRDYPRGDRDYPRGDTAYPPADPGYLPSGGSRDFAPGGAPDYLPDSPRRSSADHTAPYESWSGRDSGAHSPAQGWTDDYRDATDGDYGYAPPGSARHSR